MDPTQTLIEFLEACEEKDHVKAEEYLEYLYEWVVKGGHLPNCAVISKYGGAIRVDIERR